MLKSKTERSESEVDHIIRIIDLVAAKEAYYGPHLISKFGDDS